MNYSVILNKLSKSAFRSRFKLGKSDVDYINKNGLDKIRSHAYDFVRKRLSDTSSVTDGKQTPMRGHPVFVAQHATATCCRGCLFKWHKIEQGRLLTDAAIEYIVGLIMAWINLQING